MANNSTPAPNGASITSEELISRKSRGAEHMAVADDAEHDGKRKRKRKADCLELGVVPTPTVTGDWTVEKATAALNTGMAFPTTAGSTSPLAYFHLLELLKTTKREGWRRFGVNYGESIADHMYRMSLISMLAPPQLASRLDINRCIKMCLIHDMAESLVGDITPVDGVPKPEKSRREATTMDYITETLLGNVYGGASAIGKEIRAIWQEYEDSQTPESHFVHDVDKMELLLQMVEYEKRGKGAIDLVEFAYVATKMTLPETRAWAAEVLQERDAFWAAVKGTAAATEAANGVSAEHKQKQDAYYDREANGSA